MCATMKTHTTEEEHEVAKSKPKVFLQRTESKDELQMALKAWSTRIKNDGRLKLGYVIRIVHKGGQHNELWLITPKWLLDNEK